MLLHPCLLGFAIEPVNKKLHEIEKIKDISCTLLLLQFADVDSNCNGDSEDFACPGVRTIHSARHIISVFVPPPAASIMLTAISLLLILSGMSRFLPLTNF
jgi:hypothetical protein|tara:strand:+ start:391 stop:693 length:303 start_codon:yes stop_codon:yes gene_type:complete